MSDFGVKEDGFVRKRFEDIRTSISNSLKADIDANLDTSPESAIGQHTSIVSRELALAWESLETCYHAFDPDAAEDVLFENLAKLTGSARRPANHTIVQTTVHLNIGVTLESDIHFAARSDRSDIRATPVNDFTAPFTGEHTISFRAENTGPVEIPAGLLTEINTPISGWNSVNNVDDGVPGRNAETIEEFRIRRANEIQALGSCTVDAIRSDVAQIQEGNLNPGNVIVIENTTQFPQGTVAIDGYELPPHSFMVVISEQTDTPQWNNLIAQKIWDNKPAGIRSYGTNTEGIAIDQVGTAHNVKYNRSIPVPIYIEIDIGKTRGNLPDPSAVASEIARRCNERFKPGDNVISLFVECVPLQFEGILDVDAIRLGKNPNPSSSANIPIKITENAVFLEENIIVNGLE